MKILTGHQLLILTLKYKPNKHTNKFLKIQSIRSNMFSLAQAVTNSSQVLEFLLHHHLLFLKRNPTPLYTWKGCSTLQRPTPLKAIKPTNYTDSICSQRFKVDVGINVYWLASNKYHFMLWLTIYMAAILI